MRKYRFMLIYLCLVWFINILPGRLVDPEGTYHEFWANKYKFDHRVTRAHKLNGNEFAQLYQKIIDEVGLLDYYWDQLMYKYKNEQLLYLKMNLYDLLGKLLDAGAEVKNSDSSSDYNYDSEDDIDLSSAVAAILLSVQRNQETSD